MNNKARLEQFEARMDSDFKKFIHLANGGLNHIWKMTVDGPMNLVVIVDSGIPSDDTAVSFTSPRVRIRVLNGKEFVNIWESKGLRLMGSFDEYFARFKGRMAEAYEVLTGYIEMVHDITEITDSIIPLRTTYMDDRPYLRMFE